MNIRVFSLCGIVQLILNTLIVIALVFSIDSLTWLGITFWKTREHVLKGLDSEISTSHSSNTHWHAESSDNAARVALLHFIRIILCVCYIAFCTSAYVPLS